MSCICRYAASQHFSEYLAQCNKIRKKLVCNKEEINGHFWRQDVCLFKSIKQKKITIHLKYILVIKEFSKRAGWKKSTYDKRFPPTENPNSFLNSRFIYIWCLLKNTSCISPFFLPITGVYAVHIMGQTFFESLIKEYSKREKQIPALMDLAL